MSATELMVDFSILHTEPRLDHAFKSISMATIMHLNVPAQTFSAVLSGLNMARDM